MADSRKNYWRDLGGERVKLSTMKRTKYIQCRVCEAQVIISVSISFLFCVHEIKWWTFFLQQNTLFLLVPTWRPSHITAWNTSSTSILLSWKPLADPYFLHGILRGYHITYHRLDGLESTVQVRVCSSTLSLEVESLDEYVEYEFRVLAYTVKGAGPFHRINSTTDQDGKGSNN